MTIPIVFAIGEDPVKRDLVSSLDRPGGNVTGGDLRDRFICHKKAAALERTAKPAAVGFLLNPNNRETEMELIEAQNSARELRLELLVLKVGNDGDMEGAFATAVQQRAGGLLWPAMRSSLVSAIISSSSRPTWRCQQPISGRCRRARRIDELWAELG